MTNICHHCSGYLLGHPEEKHCNDKWLKCNICGYCKKEQLVGAGNLYKGLADQEAQRQSIKTAQEISRKQEEHNKKY